MYLFTAVATATTVYTGIMKLYDRVVNTEIIRTDELDNAPGKKRTYEQEHDLQTSLTLSQSQSPTHFRDLITAHPPETRSRER